MNAPWFSAMLRFAIAIEGVGIVNNMGTVVVFRASSFDTAKRRALDLGHEKEVNYLNELQQHVSWRLTAVETLDMLGDEISDGREVYSEPNDVGTSNPADYHREFSPELSEPTQSGV